MTNPTGAPAEPLDRRLGLGDGVALGLAAMIGAGLFSAFAPAAASDVDDRFADRVEMLLLWVRSRLR